MTRFMDLPTEFKFNSLHHSAKNSSIKKWNNKDGELAQLTELSLVLSDQCCMEIQNFTFIDLVLPYFMSQLYSWLNMSKCLSFKEWITTKLCWSAFQLVLQMLQNTACLVFNQPKRAAAPRTAPYYTTCSKCMFPPLSTIIEVWCLVIPSQPGTQRPLLSLCCDLLHDNQSKHSFSLDHIRNTFAEKTSRYWLGWTGIKQCNLKVQHICETKSPLVQNACL